MLAGCSTQKLRHCCHAQGGLHLLAHGACYVFATEQVWLGDLRAASRAAAGRGVSLKPHFLLQPLGF